MKKKKALPVVAAVLLAAVLIAFLFSLISGFLLHNFSDKNDAQVMVASYVAASVLNRVSVVHFTMFDTQFHSSSGQEIFALALSIHFVFETLSILSFFDDLAIMVIYRYKIIQYIINLFFDLSNF